MKTNYITFKSNSGNDYLYSYYNNQIIFIKPIIAYFLKLKANKINISKWINEKKYEIEFCESYSQQEIFYYYKKYIFLQKNNFFKCKDNPNILRYRARNIKYQLANTNQVSFEVTDNCNLSCEYCIYGKFYINRDKPKGVNLDIHAAKKVLDYMLNLWDSSLNCSHKKMISIGFYGGEALLNMNFITNIVEYTKKMQPKHIYFDYNITTNGVLLNNHISYLVENNFKISISLDGCLESENIYRKFSNGESAFNLIYNNILLIQSRYSAFFDKNINFLTVLHNMNPVDSVYENFIKKFNKIPLTINLDVDSINPELETEFRSMQKNVSKISDSDFLSKIEKKYFVDTAEELSAFLFTYSGYVKNNYVELINDKKSMIKYPTGTCEAFSRKVFVTASGKLLPCERIGHQFQLGFVNENEFCLDLNKSAKRYNNYFDNISKKCSNCYLRNSCGICMFKQNIESKNVECTGFMDYGSFSNMFSQNLTYLENDASIYSKILKKISYI